LSEESLFEVLGAPESEELVRIDGKPLDDGLPSHIIKATNWDHWIDEDDEDLRILDFGETFRQGAEPESLAQPGHLQVPETIFTDKFDYRVDLWRAGLMVDMLYSDLKARANVRLSRSIHSYLEQSHSNILGRSTSWLCR
jgi:hypothetical protein